MSRSVNTFINVSVCTTLSYYDLIVWHKAGWTGHGQWDGRTRIWHVDKDLGPQIWKEETAWKSVDGRVIRVSKWYRRTRVWWYGGIFRLRIASSGGRPWVLEPSCSSRQLLLDRMSEQLVSWLWCTTEGACWQEQEYRCGLRVIACPECCDDRRNCMPVRSDFPTAPRTKREKKSSFST
jgi:hypothetical protein